MYNNILQSLFNQSSVIDINCILIDLKKQQKNRLFYCFNHIQREFYDAIISRS